MKIGHHIDKNYVKSENISDQIIMAKKLVKQETDITINTIGIFVFGPKSYKVTVHPDDYDNIKKLHMNIFVHNAYVCNPWGTKLKQALHFIRKQLEICEHINATGFILHLPKNNIEMVIQVLKLLYNPNLMTKIYLEIPAIKYTHSIFEKAEVLNELFNIIQKEIDPKLDYFGLCIDTAHLWSSGLDISSYNNVQAWLNTLKIDHKNIFFHLNDNLKKLGQAPDTHEVLMEGEIWKKYKNNLHHSGLYAFLEYIMKHNIPFIFERKKYPDVLSDYFIINKLFK